ncbi:arp2/3 complex-activating protein rickA-like [Helianthus annuus]|uniref:arp2/3 complex-activating protein rickA-like n=1 Tax=Helianthus annuus TaxID=4232 RepID=UPI000B904F84|nr:arp2/3 complex-activating protein rickA-like [Helianthus annuus]
MPENEDTSASSDAAVHKPLHPVYTVSNIQHKVRILDSTNVSYASWVKLFTLHAKGYKVLSHIDGTPSPGKDSADFAEWENIDSIVLQWIYGTLSDALLVRVLTDESTAHEAWLRVKRLFVNNKGPRSQALQHELANTTLASMSNLEAYCQKIRDLTDQLKALNFPMNDQQRVLHLVKGLPKEYDTISSILNNSLPTWEDAIEQLLSEAGRIKTRDAVTHTPPIAAAFPPSTTPTTDPQQPQQNFGPPTYNSNRGPPNNRNNYRSNSRNNSNRGPNHYHNRNSSAPPRNSSNRSYSPSPPYPSNNQQPPFYPPFWAPQYWTPPPCPYPTQASSPPYYPSAPPNNQQHRGNPRSAQANLTEVDPLEPT